MGSSLRFMKKEGNQYKENNYKTDGCTTKQYIYVSIQGKSKQLVFLNQICLYELENLFLALEN